jgi:hypothetical protein
MICSSVKWWRPGRMTGCFREGHWAYENADPQWRSLHYVAGGHFYAIGEPVVVDPMA